MEKLLRASALLLASSSLLVAHAQLIAAGGSCGFAVCGDGIAWVWGINQDGELGNGTISPYSEVPVQVSSFIGAFAIAEGIGFSLAVKSDSTVWVWGVNGNGQLGDGTTTDSDVPEQLSSLTGMGAVAGEGYGASVALKGDGTAWAWGSNTAGGLGDGTIIDSYSPVQVGSLTGLVAVSGGGAHTLVLKNDGTVWACGLGSSGQLGNGTSNSSNVPVQVNSLTGAVAIAGGGLYSLALRNDSTVWAWGANDSGQLGNGTNTNSNVPVQVSSLTGIVAVSAGYYHGMALKNDGTVWTWGYNGFGALGNGTYISSNVPVQVSSLTGVVAVAGGFYYSMVLKNDGSVWTWGYNVYGQLGNGTLNESNTPGQLLGLCTSTTVVAERSVDASILISPNPTNGTVTIDDQDRSGLKAVEVTNTMGQRIGSSSFNGLRAMVDLSAQPSGIYFLSIRGAGRSFSRHVVKE